MSIQSVSNQMDVQRAKAEKFVNASDKTVSRLARRNYNKLYSEDNKKFDKQVSTTLKTLPFVAAAGALVAGKGKKGALLSGLGWGMALAAPSIVAAANKGLVKNSPKVAKAERKHPMAALAANVAASIGAFMGMSALADKALANPKVVEAGNKVMNPVKEAAGKLAGKVASSAFVNGAKTKVVDLAVKAKNAVPASVKNVVKSAVESPVAKELGSFTKHLVKGVAKNAPTLVVLGTLGALVGKGVADARKYSGIKADIKDAQFDTAKNLVNAYSAENKELKAENARLAAGAEEVDEPAGEE